MDELSGQGDLRALFEARRRIVAAFEDIAAGTEVLASMVVAQEDVGPGQDPDPAELARLRAALEEERTANAQLEERVRALRERLAGGEAAPKAEAARAAEIDAVLAELIPLLEEAV